MADGFLGRWAKRKEAVRKGEVIPEEPPQEIVGRVPPPQPSPGRGGSDPVSFPPPLGEGEGGGTPAQESPPTLADTDSLTPASDFTRFVRPDVPPDVRNAALKKLFADPHFNVMDGLDIYIDDYTKSDPIPPEMLRRMAGARLLGLFQHEEEKEPATEGDAGAAGPQSVAQSAPALPPSEHHGDPDLRLQQDDAPGRDGAGAGPR